MKIRNLLPLGFAVLLCFFSVHAESSEKVRELTVRAISENRSKAVSAINELRAMRQSGLDALFEAYATEIKRFSETGEATEEWKRIAFALDQVAQQKDVYASRLYWHTDLEEALRLAKKQNKPVLSLRLLGNLSEEFSCANSRFFRAILYSNAEISKYLRENYVLHWKSVRPAPKVTIDFGDGRKIERTLTGNSIHYILSEDGEIIDALPGLYSPQGFLRYITDAHKAAKVFDNASKSQRKMAILRYRNLMLNEIKKRRNNALTLARVELTEPRDGTSALAVAPRAVTKMVTEETILRGISDDFSRYEPQIDISQWQKLAAIYAKNTKLDADSTAFIRRQNARTGLSEEEFAKLFQNLETYIALDTTRNDFLFHPVIYSWLNDIEVTDIEAFNSRVYAEIFKTPDSDKWLGLYSTDVYTALDGGGIIK
jgi:hypothetical protein